MAVISSVKEAPIPFGPILRLAKLKLYRVMLKFQIDLSTKSVVACLFQRLDDK